MAVTATDSDIIANVNASPRALNFASDIGGKVRIIRFAAVQGAAAGDIGSTIELCHLPRGRVRVLSKLSNLSVSAFGASRTLSIGTRAYNTIDGAVVAEAAAALDSAVDVSAAASLVIGSALTLDKSIVWTSQKGITLFATVAGGTIPAATTLQGWVAFTKD